MDQKLEQIPATGFYFRPTDHTYWLDGRPLPGYSEIMQDVGVINLKHIPADRLEKARERGSKVHLATQYLDEGRLDWATVHPALLGYVSAYMSFLDNESFIVNMAYIEVPTWHTVYRYGITPDRFGMFTAGSRHGERPAVVEIKNTYSTETYWGMQLSAQAHALHSQRVDIDPKTVLRCAVNLKPDGTYGLEVYDDQNDFKYFLACLTVYGLKRKFR